MQWGSLAILALLATAVLVAGLRRAHQANTSLADAQAAWVVAAAAAPLALPNEGPTEAPDFTASLPPQVSLPDVVQAVQRATLPLGVVLQSLQARERAPTVDLLGRGELTLTLRGDHVNLQQVLVDVLSRYPHVTLSSLRITKLQGTPGVDAVVTLSAWSRPLAPSTPGAP